MAVPGLAGFAAGAAEDMPPPWLIVRMSLFVLLRVLITVSCSTFLTIFYATPRCARAGIDGVVGACDSESRAGYLEAGAG